MTNFIKWTSLTRHEQKLMARLYGGGSTRNQDPAVILGLRNLGLIDANGLSPSGKDLCKLLELTMVNQRSIAAREEYRQASLRR